MYDPRIGRFFAIDPLAPKYPELTPYQFSSNSPIFMVEIEGLEGEPVNGAEKLGDTYDATTHTVESGETYSSISTTYGVSVDQLREWNGYKDNNIPVGGKLIVSEPTLRAGAMVLLADQIAIDAFDSEGRKNGQTSDFHSKYLLTAAINKSGELEFASRESTMELYDLATKALDVHIWAFGLYDGANTRKTKYDDLIKAYSDDTKTIDEQALMIVSRNEEVAGRQAFLFFVAEVYSTLLLTRSGMGMTYAKSAKVFTYTPRVNLSLTKVMKDGAILEGQSLAYVKSVLGKSGGDWRNEVMRRSKTHPNGGWVFREYNKKGVETGRMLEYHPGTHHHFNGHPYWKVSNGRTTVRHKAASVN